MTPIAHYLHVHLASSAAGIDLFATGGRAQKDREIGAMVLDVRKQLIDERRRLQRMARALGTGDAPVMSALARVSERVARVRRAHGVLHRSASADLIELETMRDAVAGKIAGWQALLTVVDHHAALDRAELEQLLTQGEEQHRLLTDAHRKVAARVLATS